jgi:hypothetical protein
MAKIRSPNYPVLDIGAALEAIRPAWKAEHRNKMSRLVLAKHLGYMSLNGRALGKIGAVRAYGLIDGSGDELRISDDAITTLASPNTVHVQYRDALERLALKPQLFREIQQQFPASLPSEDNLSFWLVQRGFTQEAAGKAALSYLTTMRLVYTQEQAYNPSGVEPEDAPMNTPLAGHEAAVNAMVGALRPNKPAAKPGTLQEVFNLEEGPVTLTFPANLSSASYKDLADYFELFLRKAKRRAGVDE